MAKAKKAAMSEEQILANLKAEFEQERKLLAEAKKEANRKKRLAANATKQKEKLEKQIEEAQNSTTKAVDLFKERIAKLKEQRKNVGSDIPEDVEKKAEEVEALKEKLAVTKKEQAEKLKAMGLSTRVARTTGGVASERRQRSNFVFKMGRSGWNQTVKEGTNKIVSATRKTPVGELRMTYEDDSFTIVFPDGREQFSHPYGAGSMAAVANIAKEYDEKK
jgi:hypothetical protein